MPNPSALLAVEDGHALLAPMAGVTDLPFRRLCRRLGAALAAGEMIAADPRLWDTEESRRRRDHTDEPEPRVVQIAGGDPADMVGMVMGDQNVMQLPAGVGGQPGQHRGCIARVDDGAAALLPGGSAACTPPDATSAAHKSSAWRRRWEVKVRGMKSMANNGEQYSTNFQLKVLKIRFYIQPK